MSDRRARLEDDPPAVPASEGSPREAPRGREPGPPAAARRRRGTAAHRPAARCRRLRVVAGRDAARRRERVPRRDAGRGRPAPRHRTAAGAGDAAALGLPLHRPARLHAQRCRVHLRQGAASLAGRRRDRRGQPPDRRARSRSGAGLVARRPPDRLRLEPAARCRPVQRPPGHPRRRRRDAHGHGGHARTAVELLRADVAAGRSDDRRARPSARGRRRQPQRRLAVRAGRHRRDTDRRPQPVRPARPDAGFGHEQRRDPRREPRAHRVEGRPLALLQRPGRRVVRAVADRRRRRTARAPHRGPPLHLGLARGRRTRPAAGRGSPTCARRRPCRPTCGSSTAAVRAARSGGA